MTIMKKYGLKLDPNGWFGIASSEWINHSSTALIIIDMQNYDANRNWSFIGKRGTGTETSESTYYFDRIEKAVVPAIQRLRTYFREHGMPVFHVYYGSRLKEALDMPVLWRLRFEQHAEDTGKPFTPHANAPEMQIIDELKPLPGEIVLTKVTGSAFLSTNLCDLLRYNDITSFLACGVWLHGCVENTVRVGCDLGFFPTLVEDGCAASDDAFHKAAIRVLGSLYCQVRDSSWILNHLKHMEK